MTEQAEYQNSDGSCIPTAYGDLLYLPSGSHYSVYFPAETGKTLLINFNLFDQQGREIVFSNEVTLLAHNCADVFESTFNDMCRLYADVVGNKLSLKAKLYALMNELVVFLSSDKSSTVQHIPSIQPAITYLNTNLTDDFKISKLAHMCAMSESTFRREFHKAYGCSPVKYIMNVKLQKAKQLLQFSNLSISEICEMLGFYDNAYFTRTFLHATGTTPPRYRKHGLHSHKKG